MSKRIACCVIALLVLLMSPREPFAEGRLSARIHSLGGEHVSGIIPDLYTDIGINPAYAFFAERPTLIYGYRYAAGFSPVVPYLHLDPYAEFDVTNNQVNEISMYGIALSQWRLALAAQWSVSESGRNFSDPALEWRWGGARTLRMDGNNHSDDFWSVDLAGARRVGGNHALGIRIRGSGCYYNESYASKRTEEDYKSNTYLELDRTYGDNSWRSRTGRCRTLDLQTGLARINDGKAVSEIILEASLDRVDYRYQTFSQTIQKNYDVDQEINDYSYDDDHWSDQREGDRWTYGLWFRHNFSRGISVFAGGSFSTILYDASWNDTRESLDWDLASSSDELFTGAFAGEGRLRRGRFTLKAGKTFSVHETLALHIGFHGDFDRTHAEEKPFIRYHYAAEGSIGAGEVSYEVPSSLEFTGTAAGVAFPVSIEFEPTRWFSYFAGITFYGRWDKRSTERSVPIYFMYFGPPSNIVPGGAMRAPAQRDATILPEGSIEDTNKLYSTGQTFTLGFSFHYGERFSIDLYTGSAIIPSNVNSCTLDARYRF